MRYVFLLLAFASLAIHTPALAEPLEVLYIERPSYYYTHEGRPDGFLMQLAVSIFDEAGIDVTYSSVPPSRILARLKSGARECSVGWFKRPDREAYALYTLPIYRNRPLVLVHLWNDEARFSGLSRLSEVFSDKSLRWGIVSGFSYGDQVDEMRGRLHPVTVEATASQSQLLRMLALGRFDYLLISPEELDALAMASEAIQGYSFSSVPDDASPSPGGSIRRGDVAVRELLDIPEGNLRYILCARVVGQEVIQILNRAIRTIVGNTTD